ncbi:MAG: N-acetylmuramoyl-L-alanine amidase [Christensenellaceae bacterium]|nr:N-acetylmuramoyl-L-alanine amidase [Christensenellaceae bacterium]
MKNSKKQIIVSILSIILLVGVVAFFFVLEGVGAVQETFAVEGYKVLVDAGHGDPDGGTVGPITGLRESDINISVAKYLQEKLEAAGVEVVMTRTDSNAIADTKSDDMNLRREIIASSGQDITVSIHQNFFEDFKVHGPQVFYAEGSVEGEKLAACIQKYLNEDLNPNAPRTQMASDYFIVNSGTAPAVIVECGFLSNPEEEQLLKKKKYRLRIVDSIIKGIEEYAQMTAGE